MFVYFKMSFCKVLYVMWVNKLIYLFFKVDFERFISSLLVMRLINKGILNISGSVLSLYCFDILVLVKFC